MQKTPYEIVHCKIGGDNQLVYSANETISLPREKVTCLHYHNRCEIGLCISGNGIWVTSDRIYAISSGDVVISPAGVPHYSRSCSTTDYPECICEFLYFDERRLLEECGIRSDTLLGDNEIVFPLVLTWNTYANLRNLLEKMITVFRETENKTLANKKCAHYYALFLLELKSKQISIKPPMIIKKDALAPALQKMIIDFSSGISIEELADLCSFSKGYFITAFKRAYGSSPISWLNRFRVSIAAQLLVESNISVTDIGCFVGFSSPSDLYRHFMKIYGVSPTEYRNRSIDSS